MQERTLLRFRFAVFFCRVQGAKSLPPLPFLPPQERIRPRVRQRWLRSWAALHGGSQALRRAYARPPSRSKISRDRILPPLQAYQKKTSARLPLALYLCRTALPPPRRREPIRYRRWCCRAWSAPRGSIPIYRAELNTQRADENDRQPSTYVCLFLYSPSIAPPMISTEPAPIIRPLRSATRISLNINIKVFLCDNRFRLCYT